MWRLYLQMFPPCGSCRVTALVGTWTSYTEKQRIRGTCSERGDARQPHHHHIPPTGQAVPRVHPGLRRRNRLDLLTASETLLWLILGEYNSNPPIGQKQLTPFPQMKYSHSPSKPPNPSLLSLPRPDPKSPSRCVGQTQASWQLRSRALPGCPIRSKDRLYSLQ